MKIYTRRALSLVLAIALLITCGISGLVLPTVAEPDTSDVIYVQDFQNGNGDWKFAGNAITTMEDPADATNMMATVTDRTTSKMLRSPALAVNVVAGERYIVRLKAKTPSGTKTRLAFAFYNKANGGFSGAYYDLTNTDWMYYQALFTADVDATSLEIGFYLDTTATNLTAYVDDIELIKVDDDTNLVPGGDMEGAKSYWFNNYYKKGATVVTDTIETNNKVLHMPEGKSDLWFQFMGGKTGKLYEISFRYRGGGINNWFSSSHSANYEKVGSSGASAEWTTFKMYVQTKSGTTSNYFMIRTDNNSALDGVRDVWLDDVKVREVSAVTIPATSEVEIGSTLKLTPTTTPADAALTKYTWASDAEAVATVDETGVVTGVAEGTANITVTAGPLTATCAVTVKAAATPEPPPSGDEPEEEEDNNMIANGDIEEGKVKPWTDSNWQFEEVDGNTMLKIPAGTAYNKAYYWKGMGSMEWEAGASYLVTFDAKGDEILFWVANATGFDTVKYLRTIAHDASADSNNRWVRYYVVVDVAEDFEINGDWAFHFKTYRSDSAASKVDTYIDNVSLVKMDPTELSKAEEDFDSDVLNGIIYKGAVTEFGAKAGASIVADPDDANNKVLMIPATETAKDYRFKFFYPGNAFYNLSGQFKYTIRYKGAFENLVAGNSNYLSTETTTADGWTTLTEIVDLANDASNDLVWSFGIRTSVTDPIYIDYVSLEEYEHTKVEATDITLDKTTATLEIGGTVTLNATKTPVDAEGTIEWVSDNTAVATVVDGVVTAVAAGTATITAKLGDLTATCVVTVNAAQPEPDPEPTPDPSGALYTENFEGTTKWKFNGSAVVATDDGTGNKAATLSGKSKYLKSDEFATTIKAGKRYMMRFKVKSNGEAARLMLMFYNKNGGGYQSAYFDANTATEWMTYQAAFTAQKDAEELQLGLYFENSAKTSDAASYLVDDVQVFEITPEFNFVADGDMEGAKAYWFNTYYKKEATIVTDTIETTNKVLHVPAGKTELWYQFQGGVKDKVYEISFRYRGGKIVNWFASATSQMHQNVGNSAASEEWTQFKAYVTTTSTTASNYFMIRTDASNDNAEVWIDDVVVRELDTITMAETATVEANSTITLTPSIATTDITKFTWSSENAEIATVDENGVVTGVANGTTNIYAKVGNVTAACAVTVTVPVIPDATGIKLDKEAATTRVGGIVTLTATVMPTGAVLPAITWTSSDETVATVANGVVTAVKEGTATITATAAGLTPVTFTLTVAPAPEVDPNELFPNGDFEGFVVGETAPWQNFVTEETADTKVVGTVTAGVGVDGSYGLKMGSKASYGSIVFNNGEFELEKNTSYRLTFMANSSSVSNSVRFAVNQWTDCTAINASNMSNYVKKVANFDGWFIYYVDFKTGNTNPSIHGNGGLIIERSAADTKTICFDNFSLKKIDDNAELFLGGDPDVAVDPAFNEMLAATTPVVEVVTAPTASNPNNKAYKLSSTTDTYFKGMHFVADTTYKISFDYKGGKVVLGTPTSKGFSLTVDGKGTVTAPESEEWAHFETTINVPAGATYSDRSNWSLNFYRSTPVGVLVDNFSIVKTEKPAITKIEMNKARVTLAKQGQVQLLTSITPSFGKAENFVWTSADETIATVDANGMVTAKDKIGEVVIKVQVGDLTAECVVVVLPAATSFEFTADEIVLAPNRGNSAAYKTLELKTEPAAAFVVGAQWSSNNTSVATVDANGKVKALAKGTATITVTNGTISDTITVKVDDSGERITGGNFEGDDWNTDAYWTNGIIKAGNGSLVSDPTDVNNTVLSIPASMQPKWLWPALVNPGKTYKITFRAMGGGGKAYINFSSPSVPTGNGWHNKSISEDSWTTVSFKFTTNSLDDGTSAALNRNYTIGFCSQASKPLYIDDVTMVELPEATALEIQGETVKLYPGNSSTLSLTTTPAEASTGVLTWTSSDPGAVSVDNTGKVTVLTNDASATITVTNDKGLSDTITVKADLYANLLDNGDFEKGSLNWPSHANIVEGVGRDGGTGLVLSKVHDVFYKNTLNILPGTTYIVSWDYLATKDAEFRLWAGSLGLSNNGSFKDANAGKWVTQTKVFTTPVNMKDINAKDRIGWIFSVVSDKVGTYSPTIVDNVSIRVYDSGVEAQSIKLNYDAITLLPGRTQNLGIIPTPSDANINFSKWESDNEDVVTVENGIVTAIGKGVATITATTANGKIATCKVTVSGEPAFIVNGTFEAETNTAWQTTEGAAIGSGIGVNKTNGGSINGTGKLSQSFTGLKADTTYELFIRYRSEKDTKLGVNLMNGTTDLMPEDKRSQSVNASWASAKIEFKTGETLEETTTLVLSLLSGTGPVFVDHVFLAQKAELVDLIVQDVIWDGGDEQVKPGTELLFAVTVKNQGTDSIKAGSTMMVDICVDSKSVLSFPYTFASEFTGGSTAIVLGEEKWAAVEGDHVISARVNSTLSILEMDTTNNNTVQTDLRVNDVFLEVPEIAEKAGFTKLGFSDDFNSLHTIDTKATGADGYKWYVTRPYNSKTLTEDDYAVEDGILTLKAKIPTYNYSLGTTDMKTNLGYQYRYGYLETYLRIPRPRANEAGEDGVPAIWALPQSKLTQDGKRWVEMDWLEYWGINGLGSNRPEGFYTITLHDQTMDENNNQIRYNKNKNNSLSGLGDGEWHHMSWLWMENMLIAWVDGEEVWRLEYSEDDYSSSGGDLGAFSWMNNQDLPLHISGSADNPLELDYLRIWTGYGSGNKDVFEKEEEEELPNEDDIIVDMAADEFWYNYCTDDWGDNITEVTYDNYLNVLGYTVLDNGMYEAEYYWSKLSEQRKAEINELLVANGQPTFDELLAEALAMAEKVAGGWLPEDDQPEGDQPGADIPDGGEGEGGDDSDEPVDDEVVDPDADEEGESDAPEAEKPEDNAPTGATTALPLVAALTLLVSLAALVFARKRDRA